MVFVDYIQVIFGLIRGILWELLFHRDELKVSRLKQKLMPLMRTCMHLNSPIALGQGEVQNVAPVLHRHTTKTTIALRTTRSP